MFSIVLLVLTAAVGVYVAYTMWELAGQTRKAWRSFCDCCEQEENEK